ncbi:hypothetical protein DITRI_Ditri16bG0021400 [Diplodiscus trichospermus]
MFMLKSSGFQRSRSGGGCWGSEASKAFDFVEINDVRCGLFTKGCVLEAKSLELGQSLAEESKSNPAAGVCPLKIALDTSVEELLLLSKMITRLKVDWI